jgi:type II secretory pathway pseudopilin PulG
MQMKSFAISVMALTLALPTLAEAQQNQNQNQNQNQGKQAQNQQSGQNQVAQKCLDQVRAFSDDTGRSGYGLAGPNGYFTAPGYGYTWGTAPANGYPGIATPRGEMRTLIRAAYVLAMNGDQQTCQTVLDSAKSLRDQRGQQMKAANTEAGDMNAWRNRQLASAVPVSNLKSNVRLDQVTGADIRNRQDEDLGDIEDVVLNKQGQIEYALISRGGFLGIGDELVPVRWNDLSVTPSPFRDTFVLNATESVLESAPTVGENEMNQVASTDWGQQVDQFWNQHISSGGQQSGGAKSSQ